MSAWPRPTCGELDEVLSTLVTTTGFFGASPFIGSPVSGHRAGSSGSAAAVVALVSSAGAGALAGSSSPPHPASSSEAAARDATVTLRRRGRRGSTGDSDRWVVLVVRRQV
jgi:hypothetical protein